MSIVNLVSNKLPEEGSVVYCDNGNFACDRAVFSDGEFTGGGEYPSRSYVMTKVTKWFYLKEYSEHHKSNGILSYTLNFDIADSITG